MADIKKLKEIYSSQSLASVSLELPSKGIAGYPANCEITEMTTAEEKRFTKQLLVNRMQAIIDLLNQKVKFQGVSPEENSEIIREKLLTMDRDFLLVELSRLTFPDNTKVKVVDEGGHTHEIELDYADLKLVPIPDDFEYPIPLQLDDKLTVYFQFMNSHIAKLISQNTAFNNDSWEQQIFTIGYLLVKAEFEGEEVNFESILDKKKFIEVLPPKFLKKILLLMNNEILATYGYKIKKQVFCSLCNKNYIFDIEPLNFFPSL